MLEKANAGESIGKIDDDDDDDNEGLSEEGIVTLFPLCVYVLFAI